MDDFTIAIRNLPEDYKYNNDSELLRLQLTSHILNVINKEHKKHETSNKEFEISDINFVYRDEKEIAFLKKL
jgi:hypothetical protein